LHRLPIAVWLLERPKGKNTTLNKKEVRLWPGVPGAPIYGGPSGVLRLRRMETAKTAGSRIT
jgi:hypothetical protein